MNSISLASVLVACMLLGFNFQSGGATDFLEYLRGQKSGVFTIEEPMENWVKSTDIDRLVDLLDSNKPCMSVALSYSSTIKPVSTIGDEAALLIDGFRAGRYPPTMSSRKYSKREKADLKKWWIDNKETAVRRNE